MTPILNTLIKSGRVALVAMTLGAATVTAMPAQAQSNPSFNFQLGIGNDGNVLSFGFGNKKGFHPIRNCLTDRQVINGLRHYGFRNIEIVNRLSRTRVQVEASFRGRDYRMTVNRCTGEVTNIRRVGGHNPPPRPRPFNDGPGFGFGFQFNSNDY